MVSAPSPLKFPIPTVCPACRGPLSTSEQEMRCDRCAAVYPFCNGFPDLIVGGRFEGPDDEQCMCYEEQANSDTARSFWVPLFQKLFPNRTTSPRLLALGTGTGTEVDLLCEAGFDCVGIDCGNRTNVWPRRAQKDRLLLANGMNLPFPDATFDAVFCGCVFPHVGVVGDSNITSKDCENDRRKLAAEMSRVLKPGGHIIVSSPNRWFPFDLFHGRAAGSYKPRFNWPWSKFLLSLGDYRKLFQAVGCKKASAMAVAGYWSFLRSRKSLKGRLLGAPVRAVFSLASPSFLSFLRPSPLSPWLVVQIEK